MSWRDKVPFMKPKKAGLAIAPYGGGVRPPVMGPSAIQARLSRLALVRTILTSAVAFLVIAIAVTSFILVSRMDTRLYVADGTPFGCPVTELGAAE